MDFDSEQKEVIRCKDNVIVSASAGSGKTTVMIECLVNALCDPVNPADLSNVIAVTFTDEAAASMKTRLRDAIIKRIISTPAGDPQKGWLIHQLDLVPSADISTIHSFCAQLIRRYFYLAGCDGTFEILADDTAKKEYMRRAVDSLFDKLYADMDLNPDSDFSLLLQYYGKSQKDGSLRELITDVYDKVRPVADYRDVLASRMSKYTPEGFEEAYGKLLGIYKALYCAMAKDIEKAGNKFTSEHAASKDAAEYREIFATMHDNVCDVMRCSSFENIPDNLFKDKQKALPKRKSSDPDDTVIRKEFTAIREVYKKAFPNVFSDIGTKDEELTKFLAAGRISRAFLNVLLRFDDEYAALKRNLNLLDYDDLEHKAIDLLKEEKVKEDIRSKYKLVFVDEFQDINPVQYRIISAITGEENGAGSVKTFYVGDSKQAIYGFRGCSSEFFTKKAHDFSDTPGCSKLPMKYNHRSLQPIIKGVNAIFSVTMTGSSKETDDDTEVSIYPDLDYSKELMEDTKKEPAVDGDDAGYLHSGVRMVVFGKKSGKDNSGILPIYSVRDNPSDAVEPRQGLAVLRIVQDCLGKKRFDADANDGKGAWVDIKYDDICILSRTRKGAAVVEDVLVNYGYPVASVEKDNICDNVFVKQMLDILTYIDNPNLDIPLASALLSPLGQLSEDDLAAIRIRTENRSVPFRTACYVYLKNENNCLSAKLEAFYEEVYRLRKAATVLTAGEVIEMILSAKGFTDQYPSDGDETMRYMRELIKQGTDLSVTAFLNSVEKSDNEISVKASAPSNSIRVMTMHGAKGLEFPIVIITDICRTFNGGKAEDIYFNMEYGLAPYYYDEANKVKYYTVLRKLEMAQENLEGHKNEVNLFYVACTRAINNLYIMAESMPGDYQLYKAHKAQDYAHLINFDKFFETCKVLNTCKLEDLSGYTLDDLRSMVHYNTEEPEPAHPVPGTDEYKIRPDIPLMSSASAMVKAAAEDAAEAAESSEASSESEDIKATTDSDGHAAERGTAYHRFLELCDFKVKDESGILAELQRFVKEGQMSAEQARYLEVSKLVNMVNMPVFKCLDGAEDERREQNFFCPIPADKYMGGKTDSTDEVIVQGAMDLLVKRDGKWQIIDYKYSDKDPQAIENTYKPQIKVYRQVLSRISGQPVNDIPATIVNIKKLFPVVMPPEEEGEK